MKPLVSRRSHEHRSEATDRRCRLPHDDPKLCQRKARRELVGLTFQDGAKMPLRFGVVAFTRGHEAEHRLCQQVARTTLQ